MNKAIGAEAKIGMNVRVLKDEQGNWPLNGHIWDSIQVRKYLRPDTTYTVVAVDIGDWDSTLALEGFPDLEFNTVCFYEVEG